MEKKLKMVQGFSGQLLLFFVTDCASSDVESVIDEIEGSGGSVTQIGDNRIEGSISGDSKELTEIVKKLLKSGWST